MSNNTPSVSIRWNDPNVIEDGYNIYRSDIPMDINNMPTPLVKLSKNTTSYVDDDVVEGNFYYYRVSATASDNEVFSVEVRAEAISSTIEKHDIFNDNSGVYTLNFNNNSSENLGFNNDITEMGNVSYPGNGTVQMSGGGGLSIPSESVPVHIWEGFTFSAKIYSIQKDSSYIAVFNKGYDNCIQSRVVPSGEISFRVVGDTTHTMASNQVINDNTWYHVVLTYNRIIGIMELYIDGIEKSKITNVSSVSNITSDLYIGAGHGYTRHWNGYMDQIRVLNRHVTPDEVSTLYNESIQE